MKISFVFLPLFFLFLHGSNLNAQSQILMPLPHNVVYGKDRFSLSRAKVLISNDFSLEEQNLIEEFITYVKSHTGITLMKEGSQNESAAQIILSPAHGGPLLPTPGEKVGPQSREAYRLKVTPKKVMVSANAEAGIFYAFQTLYQLLKLEGNNSYIPEVSIEDFPAFAYRGVMMDVSHGGLPTESEIKSQIDFLARWKMNQYYFYNEVSIAMKGYPLVNYKANYSQDQVKRIITYAKNRHIDVVPFVNLYGHLHELLRVEKYAGLAVGNYGHELDPRNPAVQSLLADWLKQYASLFPSPFIHVGFDETWETKRLSLERDSTINPKNLYLDHLSFVAKTLQGFGKVVLVWTDITMEYPDIISGFPPKVIPVIWEYSSDTSVMRNWIKPIARENRPFFIQSAVDGWQHVYPSAGYTFDNIDLCIKVGHENSSPAYINSVWADAVQTLMRNSWIYMAYGCIGSWQQYPVDRKNFVRNYSEIVYPSIAGQMTKAFEKLQESQTFLENAMGSRHTLTDMWADPFSKSSLKNTNAHVEDYKKARLAAELAQEALMDALGQAKGDSSFLQSLLVNSRLLHYTATRFLWAKNITDRWNGFIKAKQKNDAWVMYYDIDYSAHGFITDMLDYCSEIKQEYQESWLSENMPYRLENMLGRFDAEYLFWRNMQLKMLYYENQNKESESNTFEEMIHENPKSH